MSQTISQTQELNPPPSRKPLKLGEELPIFCEKCGYSLNGLAHVKCDQCEVLHFACPECGHHQPINTLRPAIQRVLGRLRAFVLGTIVVIKILFFLILLLIWFGMGGAWSYRYEYHSAQMPVPVPPTVSSGTTPPAISSYSYVEYSPMRITKEALWAFSLVGVLFGIVGRMLLLRWKNGAPIGAVLCVLAMLAIAAGALIREYDMNQPTASPWTSDWAIIEVVAGAMICLGALVAWPIWAGLVRAFLPQRTGKLLLDWQRNLSQPAVAEIGRA